MATDPDVLRAGFAAAYDLVSQARQEARELIADAERRSDLLLVAAERDAAHKRNEAELYLQKARAVLEIAQLRARPRSETLDLTAPGEHEPELVAAVDEATRVRPLPGELDRLLGEAVSSAVADSMGSTRGSVAPA